MALRLKFLILSLLFCGAFSFATNLGKTIPIKFVNKKMVLSGQTLLVEIADDNKKQEQGLMYRKKLENDHGMLFIFKEEKPRAFWMQNTFIDLDIGFFNSQKILIDVQTMKAMKSVMDENLPSYVSKAPAQYALEVPKGWFEKNKVKLGSTFILKE